MTNAIEPSSRGERPRILYCHCAFAQVVPTEVKKAVLEGLVQSNQEFDLVPDLCEMSARQDPLLESLSKRSDIRIAACYPRAVYGLFTAAGCSLPHSGPKIVNLRVLSAPEALETLLNSQSDIDIGKSLLIDEFESLTDEDSGTASRESTLQRKSP